MTNTELKPCPFCRNDYPSVSDFIYEEEYEVHCANCKIAVYPYSSNDKTRTEAIAAWNRRPE